MFFDVLCNHEKDVYRFSRYSVRGVALAFSETIPLAQVAHTPEEWCHIWDDDEWKTVYNWLKENHREIDKNTVRSLCKSLDEAEDIIWTLGLS